MKIGRDKVKRLTQRTIASGIAYYWQPTPAERTKGWKGQPLGGDLAEAVRRSRLLNDEVDGWKSGGATKRAVKAHVKAQSFGAVLDRYERERLPQLAATTRRVMGTDIAALREWAGQHPVHWITRDRVRVLRQALMKHATLDGPGHTRAFNLLKALRTIMSWAIREMNLSIDNPATDHGLRPPAPRDQIWEEEDVTAFVAAARANGRPGMALAVELAAWTGQREGDLLELTSRKWKESPPLTPEETAALVGPDGRVMGFEVDQNKGRRARGGSARPLFLYFPRDMRRQVEAAFAANAKRNPATTTLLVDDRTGLPWVQMRFVQVFSEIRQLAIDAGHTRLADLQFRDLRRTCVVRLGRRGLNDAQVSAISGHRLETTKRILEVYMPRDYKMGASAAIAMLPVDRRSLKPLQSRNSD